MDVLQPLSATETKPQFTLLPGWLRPASTVLVCGVHLAALGGFGWFATEQITPLKEVSITLIPQGETVTETSEVPTPESAPQIAPSPPVLAAPDPHDDPDVSEPTAAEAATQPIPDLALPAPKVEAPDAIALPLQHPELAKLDEKKKKMLAQIEQRAAKKKAEKEAKRRAALRALKRAKAEMHARQRAAQAQLGAPARRAGVRNGQGEGKMSNAAYAALVSAEINRHKHYPVAAREADAVGTAHVVFSVGPSGTITSVRIVRSSGNAALDSEVREMMAEAHPPPPPGGHFRGSIPISFNIGR